MDSKVASNSDILVDCGSYHNEFEIVKNVDHVSISTKVIAASIILDPVKQDYGRAISKPRTALFQGREDDEPMAPQDVADKSNVLSNIAAGNYLKSSDVKFGALFLNEKYIANMEKFIVAGSSPISFTSATVKKEENISSKYIYIGTMRVDINASHI